jgi:hypothetical protein
MSQTDQENLNEHPKETTVHNQIKMTSVSPKISSGEEDKGIGLAKGL